mgnify:CR=1 FL=1
MKANIKTVERTGLGRARVTLELNLSFFELAQLLNDNKTGTVIIK